MKFTDADVGAKADVPPDSSAIPVAMDSELGRFLSRPFLISSTVWQEGSVLSHTFNPWHLFFDNVKVGKKIDNYAFLRCTLKLKVMLNASPFYYGLARVAYRPLQNLDPGRISNLVSSQNNLIPESQRPGFWIYATSSTGGEMTLPFLYYKSWLDVTNGQDFIDMGEIQIRSPHALLNANTVVGSDVDVQIFAWAENVELSTPTVELSLQAKDEYEEADGVISRPASAIARISGMLTEAPVIGPLATATNVVASSVSKVAAFFGWTNTPVIEDVSPFKDLPFHSLSSTEIGAPVEKLTLDPKNELTVDPRVWGLTDEDCMTFSHICGRESYITEFDWTAARVHNDLLFSTRINPNFFVLQVAGNNRLVQRTPMCHVSKLFEYWRGGIKLRFQIIASQYHRGRLRFSWDPIGNQSLDPNNTNVSYNRIVDIVEENDIYITIPYNQATAWLRTDPANSTMVFSDTTPQVTNSVFDNGTMYVRVLNQQTSPVAGATIKVVMSVVGCEDLQFAAPLQLSNNISVYSIQASDEMFEMKDGDQDENLVYMGEYTPTLRQLLRRSSLSRIAQPSTDTTSRVVMFASAMARHPLYPGYDSNGINTAQSLTGGANFSYNFVNQTPYTHMAPCFVGQRGSFIWHINCSSATPVSTMRAFRSNRVKGTAGYNTQSTLAAGVNTDTAIRDLTYNVYSEDGSGGQTLINQNTQSGMQVLVPFYSRFKFISNDPATATLGESAFDTDRDTFVFQFAAKPISSVVEDPVQTPVELYNSIGTDFSFVMFLNVPTFFDYLSIPFAA